MLLATELIKAIDIVLEEEQESSFRWHLGASVIGKECAREIYYSYRWAKTIEFEGRMLRLFDRGHREEERFIGWLRAVGATVWDRTPDGKQLRVPSAVSGHFGGSKDGVALNIPGVEQPVYLLTEFKTHNDKSFKNLVKNGVEESKPAHFIQMQVYGGLSELPLALYLAINKNDDALHAELIPIVPEVLHNTVLRATTIITSNRPPQRISNSPSFYKCKFCDFSPVCHKKELPAVNCRTCNYSRPVENGDWYCSAFSFLLTKDIEEQAHNGCSAHSFIPALIE